MPNSPISHSIISLGEVLWDLFPDESRFGGAAANFACHASLLGGSVTMLSAIGMDARGEEALRTLERFRVNTSLIQRIANAETGTVGVTVDRHGKPSFVIHADAAWDHLAWSPEFEMIITQADAIYFGTLCQRCPISRTTIRQALAIAKKHDVRRVLDVNLRSPYFDDEMIRDSISLASILKLSDEEFPLVASACGIVEHSDHETALRSLLNRFELDLVAMTRGAEGAMLVTADKTIEQPGVPVVVCDTVGAGDAFTAALTIAICSEESIRTIGMISCKVASAACEYAGAIPT